MSNQALRDYINHHLGSTTVLAALGVALDALVTGTPLQPALQEQIEEVRLKKLKLHAKDQIEARLSRYRAQNVA